MYKGKRILATISARGGSKGVPGKNIRDLGGLPLIAWTIREARRSAMIDRLVVSSDDEGILAVARSHGAETPFVRPAELARDDTPGVDPVLHAVEALKPEAYDYVVLLQPTSPLRTVEDIDGCIAACLDGGHPCVLTVTQPEKSPYFMFTMAEDGRMSPVIAQESYHTRRQDLPRVFAPNGAVYVADCQWLARTRSYLTPETRGFEMPRDRSQDVDDLLDFDICELLLRRAGRIS
ncbi:MAG: acylneuraminate cytidylyltransferase family protein [Humidesulfovibrio sp.]|jgi:N-acylneuraminate cytidylyltransferase|uniref:acylneuraminate cytidylyltransferase family protein n=1 Tax=Humidesulfovibrio sp. TaxID=2910988 RepID=UPI002733B258|nr:acylneuraminate cytidylyltransferase family protein [Humidesulfovibrio sp.]MDP2849425.1 acylneuraminate cytidylyltransferase family protein [Humidesulfovibrio sp.]